jgi:hypothetical protein
VLHVRHDGAAKMVGLIIRHPTIDAYVFYHGHRDNKRHRDSDCPSPLDVALVRLLARVGIERAYDFEMVAKTRAGWVGTMRMATVAEIAAAGTIMQGGRLRHALPASRWRAHFDVLETYGTVGGQRRRTYIDEGLPLFVAPVIEGPLYEVPPLDLF